MLNIDRYMHNNSRGITSIDSIPPPIPATEVKLLVNGQSTKQVKVSGQEVKWGRGHCECECKYATLISRLSMVSKLTVRWNL